MAYNKMKWIMVFVCVTVSNRMVCENWTKRFWYSVMMWDNRCMYKFSAKIFKSHFQIMPKWGKFYEDKSNRIYQFKYSYCCINRAMLQHSYSSTKWKSRRKKELKRYKKSLFILFLALFQYLSSISKGFELCFMVGFCFSW